MSNEGLRRGLVCNAIAAIKAENNSERQIHLLTEYNTLTGNSYTVEDIYTPSVFDGFCKWMYARVSEISDLFSANSTMFQTVITGKPILRHTPAEMQRIYMYSPFLRQMDARVLADTYHDSFIRFADVEALPYWQSIKTRDTVKAKPVYTGTDGTVTMESSVSLARIMAGVYPGRRKADPGVRISHDFKFTIYNCVPTAEDIASKKVRRTDKWIMTIAQIVKELDDLLLPIADTCIRVRHYVSHRERYKLSRADKNDRDAMLLNLHVLNTVIPLLSLAEDYDMDQTQVLRRFWFDSRDVCLIRHTSRIAADSSEVPGRSGDGNELSSTMYYLLVFTNVGDCYACCLGSEEASHIYRFFSIDSTAKETLPAEKTRPVNPNQSFYQIGSQHKTAMIHPDLCFDSVPPNLRAAVTERCSSRYSAI